MKLQPLIPVPVGAALLAVSLLAAGAIYARELVKTKSFEVRGLLRLLRVVAALVLVFVISLRPMRESHDADVKLSNLDILFVVDSTISMWAEDYDGGERMNGVREDIAYIMMMLPGANYGLITFADHSEVQSPFTQDTDTLKAVLGTVSRPGSYTAKGTNLNTPLHDLESLLISSSKKENRQAVVFYFSDGEITDGSERETYENLAYYISGGAVLGYGTEEGGKMRDEYYGYVYDSHFNTGLSKIDEENLQEMAQEMGIEYLHREPGASLGPILTRVQSQSRMVAGNRKDIVTYQDTYYYYVPWLAGLLLWELIEVLWDLPGVRGRLPFRKKERA
ncbi:MAG: VWA domain-containing protein [Lachnospiraceae bacterium]|nr:VWA domain-containing protein [Lachnospiraceae bacterium]